MGDSLDWELGSGLSIEEIEGGLVAYEEDDDGECCGACGGDGSMEDCRCPHPKCRCYTEDEWREHFKSYR